MQSPVRAEEALTLSAVHAKFDWERSDKLNLLSEHVVFAIEHGPLASRVEEEIASQDLEELGARERQHVRRRRS